MDLASLRAFVGNLLDYDPTSTDYSDQIDVLLNDAQDRVLTDKNWDFCQLEDDVRVMSDASASFGVTNGSATVAGAAFPWSASGILPGSEWDHAAVTITDSAGISGEYRVAWVSSVNQLYLDRDFVGTTGTYSVTVKQREVYLQANTAKVLMVSDNSVGTPRPMTFLSKFARSTIALSPTQEGTSQAFLPSSGTRIPAPRSVTGVAIATPGAGRGVRTLNVYLANVVAPGALAPSTYREGVSGGLESGLSAVMSVTLADTEELALTPETLPASTGLYRRYYFTCPALGIKAPVRLRQAAGGTAGNDTVVPLGGVTLTPDTSLATLTGQSFQSTSVRFLESNGVYQSFQLYPHPSAETTFGVRRLINPSAMREDQDVPLVPESFAQIVAYAALEQVTLKHESPAMSNVYERKKMILFRSMEASYLGKAPRRIIKGGSVRGILPNPYGVLTFT